MPPRTIGPGPNPDGLCMCGCGQLTKIATRSDAAVPMVAGTPKRYLLGHQNRKLDFLVDENGCWVWQQYVTSEGYGIGRFFGERQIAHRGMYEQVVGDIPEGMHLHHRCENRGCVNPDHLEPVTPRENFERSRAGKLSLDDVRAIRASGEPPSVVARRFGIVPAYVTKIRKRRVWAHVDAEACSACDGTGFVRQEAA